MIHKSLVCIILFAFFSNEAQVNYDSIAFKIKEIKDPRKKMEVYIKQTNNVELSVKDYEIITNDLVNLGKELKKESYAYVIISSLYRNHNNFDKAIEYANVSLKYAEKDKDTIAFGNGNYSIAKCFSEQKNLKKSLFYYRNSIIYFNQIPNASPYNKLKDVYNSIGTLFKDNKQYDSALFYHQIALELSVKSNDRKLQAYSYNNIGLVYNKMNMLDKALLFYNKSAIIKKELKDYKSLCGTIINKSAVLAKAGRNEEALLSYEEGIKMAEENKRGEFLIVGVFDLASLQAKMKNYKASSENFIKHRRIFDSINEGKENKQLNEIAAKYETEKKDAEILKSREDIKNQQIVIRKQKQLNYAVLAGLLLAFISMGIGLRSHQQNKKYSINLSNQKNLIEIKNKEITDSINYAKRIQESLFTSKTLFKENTSDFFILFKPKDIVSGDFYWANKTEKGFLIMCGDCTGHGVPGAFMSLLGINYLTEIVQHQKIIQPNLIFNELKNKIVSTLNKKENSGRDGMDASMIKINDNELEFACSQNPIWIIRNNQVIKFKADKLPIGKGEVEAKTFTHQTLELQIGDCIYMFTDGLADQFGGPNGKKFKIKQFEQQILENVSLKMEDQKLALEKQFIQWKGSLEQVDDVLIIGIRV